MNAPMAVVFLAGRTRPPWRAFGINRLMAAVFLAAIAFPAVCHSQIRILHRSELTNSLSFQERPSPSFNLSLPLELTNLPPLTQLDPSLQSTNLPPVLQPGSSLAPTNPHPVIQLDPSLEFTNSYPVIRPDRDATALAPGVYKSEPYAGIVIIPPHTGDRCIIGVQAVQECQS